MADKRAYFKVDVGYFDNPKLAALVEDDPRAVILHLRAIAYCAQHLTDGRFPMRLVMRLACASQSDLQCLIDAGLIVPADDTDADVHDYLEHQRSAEDAKKARAAGQRGAAARWSADDDAGRTAKGNADRIADGNATPNAQRERKREKRDTTTRAAGADAMFDEFWAVYPRREDKGRARPAWAKAIKKTDPRTIIEGAKRYAARPDLHRDGGKFIKLPATWLNAEAWDNETNVRPLPQRPIDNDAWMQRT
jgi:hypothetical protein